MSHTRRPVLEPLVANTPSGRRQRHELSAAGVRQAGPSRRTEDAYTLRESQNQDYDFSSPNLSSQRSSGSAQSSPASSPHRRKITSGLSDAHSSRKMQVEVEPEKTRTARAGMKRKRGGGSRSGLASRNDVAAHGFDFPSPSFTSRSASSSSRRSKSRTRGESHVPGGNGHRVQRPVAVSHGSTSSLRNGMTRLDLGDGDHAVGRKPMRRSASSPTGRRTMPMRKASWNQRTTSSDHEASGDHHEEAQEIESDSELDVDETEEQQYTEGNGAFRALACPTSCHVAYDRLGPQKPPSARTRRLRSSCGSASPTSSASTKR